MDQEFTSKADLYNRLRVQYNFNFFFLFLVLN